MAVALAGWYRERPGAPIEIAVGYRGIDQIPGAAVVRVLGLGEDSSTRTDGALGDAELTDPPVWTVPATIPAGTIGVDALDATDQPIPGSRVSATLWAPDPAQVADPTHRGYLREALPQARLRIDEGTGRGLEVVEMRPESLSIRHPVDGRGVASWRQLVRADQLATERPPENGLVVIDDVAAGERLFGGRVYGQDLAWLPGDDLVEITVHAVSFAARLEARRIRTYLRIQPGRPIGEVANEIVRDWADGEGITGGATTTEVTPSLALDWVTVADGLTRLAEHARVQWWVDADAVLRMGPRTLARSRWTFDTRDWVRSVSQQTDRQHLRTVQTVIGATPSGGIRRDERTGDGTTRSWALDYRLERLVDVIIDGASQPLTNWSADRETSVVSLVQGAPDVPDGADLEIVYSWLSPVVVSRERSQGIALWGRIHRVEQDSAIQSNAEAEMLCEALLDRHSSPTEVIGVEGVPWLGGPLEPGGQTRVIWAGQQAATPWLLDELTIRARGTHLLWSATLQQQAHQSRWEEYWRRRDRLTDPTIIIVPPTPRVTNPIPPDIVAQEGLRLPVVVGGDHNTRHVDLTWARIPGGGIVRLQGSRLPEGTIEWYGTAQTHGTMDGGTPLSGRIRLYDETDAVEVPMSEVQVQSADADLVFRRRITISAEAHDYTLQARVDGTPDTLGDGISVWAAVIDVSER